MSQQQLRCAVYTRKSSEEGLEQSFNSLHAQRESCEAFITSQAHEGWKLLERQYDDGGFSGGSIDRPSLQALLADVKEGIVDVVVVYKVDRLTRSLADFAKIVEVLDTHKTSFVSVTQQFNTTTSMGRLTLNVLLSFAQFERELAGERIRDKIAASKRRGMWMGGNSPLGYDVCSRKLVVNADEAVLVRQIFSRYLKLGSVAALQAELAVQGVKSKVRTTTRGQRRGGGPFTRTMLYRLLLNPTYVGRIPHNGQSYPGLHAPIIDAEAWDEVQGLLADNKRAREPERIPYKGSALGGLLFDDRGNMMTPSYAMKGKTRRYRYYISQALLQNDSSKAGSLARVPAPLLEHIVGEAIRAELNGVSEQGFGWHSNETRVPLRRCIERVTVGREEIDILLRYPRPGRVLIRGTFVRQGRGLGFQTFDAGRKLAKERPSLPLVKATCKAFHWRALLERGEIRSLYGLARQEGRNPGYVRRVMQLAFLCPSVVQAILAGDRLRVRGVVDLTSSKVPLSWVAQRKLLLGKD